MVNKEMTDDERNKRHLAMTDFLGKVTFAVAGFTLLLGFFSEITAQVAMDSNQFDYTQNCPAFDQCSFSRLDNDTDHVRLDEVDHYWAQDVAIVLSMGFLVILSLYTRTYIITKRNGNWLPLDITAYIVGTLSLLTGLYFIFNTFVRSVHLHAWVPGVHSGTIDFSDTYKTNEFTDENVTEIVAYRVTNETSIMGEVKSSYYSIVVAVVIFMHSNFFELLGCILKKITFDKKSMNNKKTTWAGQPVQQYLKATVGYVQMCMHVIVVILSIIIVSRIDDLETSELEMRMDKGGTSEFTTNALYYTVWVVDVSNVSTSEHNHSYVPALTSTGERLESNENETLYEGDIYGISNVCRSKEDSMVTPSMILWAFGIVLTAKGISLAMQFIHLILDRMNKEKKYKTLTTALSFERAIRNFLDFGISVTILTISLMVIYNSMSTQCHRTALMNNSKADYLLRIFCALIAVILTMNYQPVQSFDSSKGINYPSDYDVTAITNPPVKDVEGGKSGR